MSVVLAVALRVWAAAGADETAASLMRSAVAAWPDDELAISTARRW